MPPSLTGHGGKQPSSTSGKRERIKIFDAPVANATVTNVGTVTNLIIPTQGTGAGQRTGDTIQLRKMTLNYTLTTQNADIFNRVRILVFIWKPNTFLVAPTLATLTNGTGTTTTQWMYDWQYSNQFIILYDKIHYLSGLATAPTVGGCQGGSIEMNLNSRVEFSPGSTLGSNQVFILYISDSLVAPFPLLEYMSRVQYSEI